MVDYLPAGRLSVTVAQFFILDYHHPEIQPGQVEGLARTLQSDRAPADFRRQRCDWKVPAIALEDEIRVHLVGANQPVAGFGRRGQRFQFLATKNLAIGIVGVAQHQDVGTAAGRRGRRRIIEQPAAGGLVKTKTNFDHPLASPGRRVAKGGVDWPGSDNAAALQAIHPAYGVQGYPQSGGKRYPLRFDLPAPAALKIGADDFRQLCVRQRVSEY